MTQFEAQDYMGIILVRYKDNSVRYKELFKFLVSEMNENSNEFKECQRLIFENEGIKISGRTYLDYEELQQMVDKSILIVCLAKINLNVC